MGQPMRSPMAAASAMIASVKRSSSGSSRRRSQVAPVSADIGFMVMLPQSLYQTSAWMRLLTVASKPAAVSRSASAHPARRAAARLADDQAPAEAVLHQAGLPHRAGGVHDAADHV